MQAGNFRSVIKSNMWNVKKHKCSSTKRENKIAKCPRAARLWSLWNHIREHIRTNLGFLCKKTKNYNVGNFENNLILGGYIHFDPNNHMSNSYVANYQEDKSRKAIVIMICEYAN